jgi:hypothetical protein
VFLAGWVVTLPLWLIPGMGIVLPVLLAGYLNYRGYSYDALSAHAGADELDGVLARERGGLYLAGVVAGLLAFVPVLNLIAPAYAGLAFIHYCLEALRRARKAPWQLAPSSSATKSSPASGRTSTSPRSSNCSRRAAWRSTGRSTSATTGRA